MRGETALFQVFSRKSRHANHAEVSVRKRLPTLCSHRLSI